MKGGDPITDLAADAEVSLDRDIFFRTLLRNLSGTLEDTVGLKLAEGYISTVGGEVGRWLDGEYRVGLGALSLSADQVADVCIDLKKRIGGDFSLISADDRKMVFGNTTCPFGEMVEGRPSLCMMTSNVFGRITADNLGYARVELDETIAAGARGCRVVVHLSPGGNDAATGREYYKMNDTGPGGD